MHTSTMAGREHFAGLSARRQAHVFIVCILLGFFLVQRSCLADKMCLNSGHSCYILNGELRCIGSNALGQLGLGETVAQVEVRTPRRSIDQYNSFGTSLDLVKVMNDPTSVTKVDLGPGEVAMHVSCFSSTTCVALQSNRVVCFGNNDLTQANDLDGALGFNDSTITSVGRSASDMGVNLRSVVGIPTTHPILELGTTSARTAQGLYTWGTHRGFQFVEPSSEVSANVTGVMVPMSSSVSDFCVRMDYILESPAVNITKLQQIFCTKDRETRTTALGGTHSEKKVNLGTTSTSLYSWTWETGYTFTKVGDSSGAFGAAAVRALTTEGLVIQAAYGSSLLQSSDSEWTQLAFPSPIIDLSVNCVLLDNRRDIQCIGDGSAIPSLTITFGSSNVFYLSGLNLTLPEGKLAERIHALASSNILYVCAELVGGGFWCVDTLNDAGKDSALIVLIIGLVIAVLCFSCFCGWRIKNGRHVRKLLVRRALHRKQRHYVTFISHHKKDAGEVANTLWAYFNQELGSKSFLDVSDLEKMTEIRRGVQDSLVLVACQTKDYLFRPWCLVELYEAILCDIPIVPVLLENQGYNYEAVLRFLRSANFASELDQRNPGAVGELRKQGIDIEDMALRISNTLPYLLSRPYNSSASIQVRTAQLNNIQSLVLDKILDRASKGSLAMVQSEEQDANEALKENVALGRRGSPFGRNTFVVENEDELVQLIEKRFGLDQKLSSLDRRVSSLDAEVERKFHTLAARVDKLEETLPGTV